MAGGKLTAKRQRFVEVYAGNGTEAARLAGFEGDAPTLAATASRLLKDANVKAALEARNAKEARQEGVKAVLAAVATRAERQAFWTKTMGDGTVDLNHRLKASELLGKSEADFTENHRHEGARVSFVFNRGKPK